MGRKRLFRIDERISSYSKYPPDLGQGRIVRPFNKSFKVGAKLKRRNITMKNKKVIKLLGALFLILVIISAQTMIFAQSDGITVQIYKNAKGMIYGFVVSGTSGYAEKGYDIIASGVSAIVLNTIQSIEKFTNDKIDREIKQEGPYIKVIMPELKNNKGSKEAIVLLKSMALGMESISSTYGVEYVKVKYISK